MKSAFILLPTLLASATTACVTAHVYLNNCFLSGDILSAQVFDNGVEVCNGGVEHDRASSDTEFCINGCQPGYSFCVTGNARTGTYKNGDVYSVTMQASDYQMNTFTCAQTEDVTFKGRSLRVA